MGSTLVFLVRHCEGTGNIDGTLRGRTDHPVTENGYRQLKVLQELMKPVPLQQVYTSPLVRARETAAAANYYHQAPTKIEKDLIEVDFGELDGKIWDDLPNEYPELMANWREKAYLVDFPGGESMEGAWKRMEKAFWACVNDARGKVILLAGHGSALRTLHCTLLGWPLTKLNDVPRLLNTSLTCVQVTEDNRILPVFMGKNDQLCPEKAEKILAGEPDEEIQKALALIEK